MLHAVIMAGGGGTRLWPVSTKNKPKQILPLFGSKTLVQMTYERLRKGIASDHIWVATSVENARDVQRQLPRVTAPHWSIEPVRRETAPALGLVLHKIVRADPHAVFVYVNADNVVKDVSAFHRVLRKAEQMVRRAPDRIVLVGVKANYPETGYGYIKIGRPAGSGFYRITAFKEKPNVTTAKRYVASGKYLWNPTLIVASAVHMLTLFERHIPRVARLLKNGDFRRIPPTTIDRGILEKEKNMLVLPADFGWTDVGHWQSMFDLLAAHPRANVVRGEHIALDSSGNLLFSDSEKTFATIGVHDLVIVEANGAILVVPKSRAQEVKLLAKKLQA